MKSDQSTNNRVAEHLLRHRRSYVIIIVILLLTVFILFGLLQQSLVITAYHITSPEVPEQFDGYRILHISDFHSGRHFGPASEIIKKAREQSPDIICLTGDIIDGRFPDYNAVEELISGLSSIAPIYSVSGNNEHYDAAITSKVSMIYRRFGVEEIDGRTVTLINEGGALTLLGIQDTGDVIPKLNIQGLMFKYNNSREGFGVILYHRANGFDDVSGLGYDLVLSGHVHGGIVRLPFTRGLLSPDGDLFPKYSGGLYNVNGTYLVSNRGIGNSHFVPRFYNPPEIVMVVLHAG